MANENILIFYQIKDRFPSNNYSNYDNDPYWNATSITIEKSKEIYLIDILMHFLSIKSVGISYTFYASVNSSNINLSSNELLLLKSPSTIVPIVNQKVALLLVKNCKPFVAPFNQMLIYQTLSRTEIYSLIEISAATGTIAAAGNDFNKPYSDSYPGDSYSDTSSYSDHNYDTYNDNHSRSRHQTSASTGGGKEVANRPSPNIGAKTSATGNNSPYSNKNMRPYIPKEREVDKGGTRDNKERGPTSTVIPSGGNSSTTTAAVNLDQLTDFSKQTAEKMKKSLFSFAQTSLQKVTEAVENVTSSVQNSSLSTVGVGGTGGSGMSYSSAPVRVGRYHVSIVKELAEGGFGVVFLVQDLSSANNGETKYFALKKMLIQSKEQQTDAQTELQALKMFTHENRHPNVIELLDSVVTGSSAGSGGKREMLLLFPYLAYGSVWDTISKASPSEAQGPPWPYTEQQALYMITGTAYALAAIHDKGWAHRDVKPHNILIADDGTPILTDLGSMAVGAVEVRNRKEALMLEDDASIRISAPYRCPELTEVPQQSFPVTIDGRVDVWALGCTMYCLAFGRSPFESSKTGVVEKLGILNGRYTTPPGGRMRNSVFGEGYLDVIKKMLTVNHTARPTIIEVIAMLNDLAGDHYVS